MRSTNRIWAFFAFCLVASAPRPAAAQLPPNDITGWFEVALRYEIYDGVDAKLSGQLRLDQKWSRVDSLISELEIGCRMSKYFKLSGGYRFAHRRDSYDNFEPVNRVHLSGATRVFVGPFSFRHRVQAQDQWDKTRKGRLKDEPTLRNAVTAAYRDLSKVEPYLSAEHFLALREERHKLLLTRKWWFTAGVDLDVGTTEIGPFYRLELPIENEEDPLMIHIVGVSVTFDPWKVAKKDKKKDGPSPAGAQIEEGSQVRVEPTTEGP